MKTKNMVLACVAAFTLLSTACLAGTRQDIRDAIATIVPMMSSICKAFKDVAGAIASLIFLWAAVQWIISRDDPAKRKQSQDTIIAVVIGILILGLSIYIVKGIAESIDLVPGFAWATFC